jgi:uncharacterized OsmC-like protein
MRAHAQGQRSALAARQAALRARYAEHPREALARKSARTAAAGIPPSDSVHGEVEVGNGYDSWVRFGVDRQVGGSHDAPNPGDLLCAALAACQDATIRMIADVLGVRLVDLEVQVSGELDVRGCLVAAPGVRVGFEALRCEVSITADEGTDRMRLDVLAEAAERLCVVGDSLRAGVEVETTVR